MKLTRAALTFAVGFLTVTTAGPAARAVEQGEVATFAGNAQHTGIFDPAAQPLNAIRWSTTIDRRQTFANTHYGSPLVTADNTVVVPVKTENDGFEVHLLDGRTGDRRSSRLDTDYVVPAHNWIPVYQPVIAGGRLYFAGAGGTLFYAALPNLWNRKPVRVAFYGLDAFNRDKTAFTSSVFVNTPLTADKAGNVYFGFRVQGTAPAPLTTTQSGFARIAPDGSGTFVLAGAAAGDVSITRDTHNSAPALSLDEGTLYVVAKAGTTNAYAYLLGLNATTLQTRFKIFLKDPRSSQLNNASVSDDSTASPMVAPDGDVYFGVLANPNNGSRGFLLRFNVNLTIEKAPGGFGWDSTPAIVPASMAPLYQGGSPYLIFTKYNNYRFVDGDGVNRIALLDPNATQVDPHATANGLIEMREVLTMIGPTPDAPNASFPFAVREWCINTAAVNPATRSILVPNEDGRIYRWDLATNSLSQAVALTPGFGEPYVPTIIGPDGTVFTLNGGTIFAVGTQGSTSLTLASSKPDARAAVAGQPLRFTASVTASRNGWGRFGQPRGTVLFEDTYYPLGVATPVKATLARVPISGSTAVVDTTGFAAGAHLITATHEDSGAATTFVQTVNVQPSGPASVVAIQQIAEAAKQRAFFTPPAHQTRHR